MLNRLNRLNRLNHHHRITNHLLLQAIERAWKILLIIRPAGLLFYGVLLLSYSVSIFAQPLHIADIDRRVSAIEAMNLDHRLTVIEVVQRQVEENILWSRITSGGTGVLILEALIRYLRGGGGGNLSGGQKLEKE